MKNKILSKTFVIILLFSLITSAINVQSEKTHQEKTNNKQINPDSIKSSTSSIFGQTYMVEMRDGISLATDAYDLLLQTKPHGTILFRTPYDKNELKIFGFLFSVFGWPTVLQDMRGRYGSEGIDTLFRNSHTDGPDTLAWIANQTWSNGKIATVGPSALGINQYFMAGANPQNLACQFIMVATPNLHKHAIYQGGQFRKGLVEGWLSKQGSMYILDEILENENYSLDFWTNVSLEDNWQDVNVPAIHLGGWYDIFLQGIIEGYQGYQHLGGPGAQGNSKLIIGPWTHEGYIERSQGILAYPFNSLGFWSLKMFRDMIRQYTMNESNSYDDWPTVSYYVMGDVDSIFAPGNEWRYANDWPVHDSVMEWYFNYDGTLITNPLEQSDFISYIYDPMDPIPTIGGQNLNLDRGPYDQSIVEQRDDVLLFTSEVLEEPYEATGPIKARLFVSSDCPDTDFTVKLTDVYPDGRSILITDGILRMRNRNGTDHWEFMEPGQIYEVEVDLWSTSYIWNKGHRIRVAVSSSNYPRFLNNPNTEDSVYENSTYNIAENTVYLGPDTPSCIILPQISYGEKLVDNYSNSYLDSNLGRLLFRLNKM